MPDWLFSRTPGKTGLAMGRWRTASVALRTNRKHRAVTNKQVIKKSDLSVVYVTMFSPITFLSLFKGPSVSQCFVKHSIRGLHDGASSIYTGNSRHRPYDAGYQLGKSVQVCQTQSSAHAHVRGAGYQLLTNSEHGQVRSSRCSRQSGLFHRWRANSHHQPAWRLEVNDRSSRRRKESPDDLRSELNRFVLEWWLPGELIGRRAKIVSAMTSN